MKLPWGRIGKVTTTGLEEGCSCTYAFSLYRSQEIEQDLRI